ncbi:MAG: PIN domain-containing protein [Bacteroidota bacterium]
MKLYISDANVIFSALISGRELYQKIVANYKFYPPDFALAEIQKYQALLLEKTKLKEDALREYTIQLFSEVVIVSDFLISDRSYI